MNKLTALIEAAKDVLDTDNICPYANAAEYNRLANPATILELCALLEKAEGAAKAFKTARDQADQYGHLVEASSDIADAYYLADRLNDEALSAIKQWKEGT